MDLRVYAIIDPAHVSGDVQIEDVARSAIRGGAGVVQLRDKTSTARELVQRARRLQQVCSEMGALFVVNDRLDVALAAGADGVHLGPEDVPVNDARRVAPDLVIGASAGDVATARRLQQAGADYLGCGAVFRAAPSKPDASEPKGTEFLEDIAREVSIPFVGIGGIHPGNARSVIEAGAAGVAVIRAICGAGDPEAAARELLEATHTGEA
jgi:thiamine-phosphate diphosphorylase